MKKTLLFILMTSYVLTTQAQLKLTENFGGMTAGNLGTQNGWVQTGSGPDAQVTVLPNNTGALTYPGYTSGTNYLTLDDVSGTSPYKPFNASVSIAANSTTYIAFLIRVPTATHTAWSFFSYPLLALRTSSGDNLAYFYVGDDNGTNLQFGIGKIGGIGFGTFSPASYNFGTTYLVVLRYDVVAAGGIDDNMYMWINPSLASEPSTASADATVTLGSDGGYTGNLSALQLFQSNFVNVFTSARAQLDAFRVANRPTSAQAWADLSPAGAPLPVRIGSIKAFENNRGVQVDWNTYSESNLDKFVIERSTDGANFTAIGEVTARNAADGAIYSFYDPSPAPGLNFYRIRNVDIDAQFSFTNIVRVNLDKSSKDVTLYPNPVRAGNYLSFQGSDFVKGNYIVKVFASSGQQVYTMNFIHSGGALNETMQLPVSLKPGVYTLRVESDGTSVAVKPFMVQ